MQQKEFEVCWTVQTLSDEWATGTSSMFSVWADSAVTAAALAQRELSPGHHIVSLSLNEGQRSAYVHNKNK